MVGINYKVKYPINTYVNIVELEKTKGFIMSIEICGNDMKHDVWYTVRWFIDGKPITERFLEWELSNE